MDESICGIVFESIIDLIDRCCWWDEHIFLLTPGANFNVLVFILPFILSSKLNSIHFPEEMTGITS